MKYCEKCGAQIADESVGCTACANTLPVKVEAAPQAESKKKKDFSDAIKILMIVGIISTGFLFFPSLCWTIPMTLVYFDKLKKGETISTVFKICTLLFVSMVAGILMLCEDN